MDGIYISLEQLPDCGKLYAEYLPLNRGTECNGLELQLVGLAKTEEGAVNLLLLEACDWDKEELYPVKTRTIKTRRQQFRREAQAMEQESVLNELSCYFIHQAEVAGIKYPVIESSMTPIGVEQAFFLKNCLKQGWSPETMTEWNLSNLGLREIGLDARWEEIAGEMLPSEKVTLTIEPPTRRIPTRKRMTLKVTDQSANIKPKCYTLSKEATPFWIDRVYLYDPLGDLRQKFADPKLAERFSPEQLRQLQIQNERAIAQFCPKGKYLPLIEYETEDGRQLDFFDQTYLDGKPEYEDSSGLLVRLDQKTGSKGFPLRAEVLQTPVDADCAQINVEVLFYWETQKEKIIIEF